jgi:hypothetical protein
LAQMENSSGVTAEKKREELRRNIKFAEEWIS